MHSDPAFVDLSRPNDLVALLNKCDVTDGSGGLSSDTVPNDATAQGQSKDSKQPLKRTVASCTIDAACLLTDKSDTACVPGPLSSHGDQVAGSGAKKGSELLYLTTHDHNHVIVHDKSEVDVHSLTYPVRATFSTKLRPARFRGKIEFRDVR